MKNIYKFLATVLCAAVVATGCIKETFPTDGATQDQISESNTALESLVGAIAVNMAYPYSAFGSDENMGFDFGYPGLMCALDACTGDVICTAGDDAAGYDWFWYWERGTMLGPTMAICPFAWNTYFAFMKSCNDVIGLVDMNNPSLSSSEKLSLGSAKAIRACFYLDMARQFEALEVTDEAAAGKYDISEVKGMTVPIIDETTTEEKARNNPRAKRDDMFKFILKDLDDAEMLLDGLSVKKTVPSKAVVYGLKARAYLWLGQFDQGTKVPVGEEAYKLAAEYARKAITESGATIMTEGEWLNPTSGFNKANNAWLWYLPQTAEGITNLVNYIAWRSSEATWGYGGKFVFEGVTTKFYERMSESDWRRKAFVGESPAAWYKQHASLTNLTEEQFMEKVPPYANMKFHPANGNTVSYTIGNVTDVPLMRVEEMYLIEAEAIAQYNEAEGKRLIEEFMTHRDPKYSANNKSNLIDEIIFQKRVELWGEGIVFYDFKRLNMGIQNGYTGTNVPSDSRVNVSGRAPWWNFCIPESEVNQNLALKDKNNPNPDGLIKLWK
ncbi:MAG: RagB/SusD family nutrient uptake outer membrane protein [Alistipes sp.]|nr:RagB/SusD family nutrient uptake outer membrane protein [Alistipes sp.]